MARQPVPFYPLDIAPGIFTEETPAGAVKRWQMGDNVRWVSDQPQKMGGYINQPIVDQEEADTTYMGKARSYHQWESLDGQSWTAFGTACKLYLLNGNTLYDITPLRQQSYITDGIATTIGSSIVTVTDVNHGAQEGDHVSFEGGTIVDGILVEGEYEVLTVLSVDTYTIDTGTVATGTTAAGGGAMTVRYDISCGLESDGFLYGYGVGDYGEETYGTPRSTSTFRGFMRTWSLDNWGEDLIASPNGGTIYVWRRSTGPQSRAEVIAGAPLNNERVMVGPDNLHIIAIGSNLASTGVQDRMFVRWCAAGNYNDWVATSTNDAGSKRLDLGSRLITGEKTNRQILLWSDKALYVTSFVGGQDVYDITLVASSPKVASPESVVDVDGTVYAMCEEDFYIFDGTYRPMECEVLSYVFGDGIDAVGINPAQRSKVTVRLRREFNEVIWSYPREDQEENSDAVIYNYHHKIWYLSSIPRETGGDINPFYDYAVGLYDGRVWLEEYGVDADTDMALPSLLESWEAQLGEGSNIAEISEMVPDFKRINGSIDVMLFGRNYPQEFLSYGPVRTVTDTTPKIDPRFKKRQMGIRIESTAVGDDWRMGTWRGKYFPHGR